MRIGALPWTAEDGRSAVTQKNLCEQEEPASLSGVEMNEVEDSEHLRERVWKMDGQVCASRLEWVECQLSRVRKDYE